MPSGIASNRRNGRLIADLMIIYKEMVALQAWCTVHSIYMRIALISESR